MFGLAIAYLKDRALPTALNVLLLALAVATLLVLLLLSTRVEDRFARDAAGVDLVVGAKGSPMQLILSSVYHLDAPTGNIPLETLDHMRRDFGVARAIPLALGDNFRGYRIVGTQPAFLSLHKATLARGRMFADPMEVVLGAQVARATGAGIGQRFAGSHGLGDGGGAHDATPFIVTGILAPTGTVTDRLILTTIPSIWAAHGIDADHGPRAEITAILVSYRNAAAAIRLPMAINRETAMQAASPATETARFLSLFDGAIAGARLFAGLIAAAAALSIFTVLLAAGRAREGDLALLRVMGASRARIFGTVLLEGVLTAGAGAALGLLLGHLLVELAARQSHTLAGIGLTGLALHPAEAGLFAAALLLGAIAALIPATRVYTQDLATTLSRAQ